MSELSDEALAAQCHYCHRNGADEHASFYMGGGVWVCFRHWLLIMLPAVPTPRRKK